MQSTLGSLVVSLEANSAKFEEGLNKADYQMRQFMGRIDSMVSIGKNAIGGLVTVETIKSFADFVQGGIEMEDQMGKLAMKTGTSVEQLAGLKFAAEQSDASLQSVADAAKKLSTNMAANPEVFAKFGITAKDTTGALVQLANIFETMPDGVDKTALAVKVLGKSGAEMIPFLNQGGAAIQALVDKGKAFNPVTTESARIAGEFNDAMKEWHANSDKMAMSLANAFLPSLNNTIHAMNDLNEQGDHFLAWLRGFAGIAKLPWDLLMPPDDLKKQISSKGMLNDLNVQLEDLKRQRADAEGGGLLNKWLYGTTGEIDKKIAMTEANIAAIKKHAAELDKIGAGAPAETHKTDNRGKNLYDDLGGSQQKGDAIISGLITDYEKEIEKLNRAMNAPTMSAVDKQFADNLAVAEQRAARAREELGKLNLAETERADKMQQVNDEEQKEIAALEALRQQVLKNNASWEYGAKVALQSYVDEAANVAKQTEAMFTKAFKGIEDALVNFVTTGKMDFKSLADSIIADIVRTQIKAQEAGVMSWLGKVFGGGVTYGSGNDGQGFATNSAGETLSFAGGGYTGSDPRSGGVDGMGGFLAVLHPQESVVDHTMPASGGGAITLTSSPVINIDSRTDQAQIQQLVSNAVKQGNAQLVDRLQRQRML